MPHFTYFSHSAFQLETEKHILLFDPFLTGNPLATAKATDVFPHYIFLSHAHSDHIGDAIAIAKRTGATVVGVWEIYEYMQKHGVQNAHPMNIGGVWNFPFGTIKMTSALHSSAFPDGTYGGNPVGYLLFLESKTIYFAGDTALTSDMKIIGEQCGSVDVAILPIGDNFTMGIDDAVLCAQWVNAKKVIPVHYNTFDFIKADAANFAQKLLQTNIQTIILQPGENVEL
jgi:L-ascorbate metabolism protein UlaG (beta-lactamase superfamily)